MDGIFDLIKNSKTQKPRNKHIHSEIHDLADIISTTFGEKNRFGMYLGIIKRIGIERARQIFSEIKNSNIDNPGKLFAWKTSKKNIVVEPKK